MIEKKVDNLKIKKGERYVVVSYIGQTLILSNVFPISDEQKKFLEDNKKCVKEMDSSEDTEILTNEKVKEFDKLFNIGLFDDYKEKPLKGGNYHSGNNFTFNVGNNCNGYHTGQQQILYSSYNVEGQDVIQSTNNGRYFAGLLTDGIPLNTPLNVYTQWSYTLSGHPCNVDLNGVFQPATIHIHLDYHPQSTVNNNIELHEITHKDLKLTYQLVYGLDLNALQTPASLRDIIIYIRHSTYMYGGFNPYCTYPNGLPVPIVVTPYINLTIHYTNFDASLSLNSFNNPNILDVYQPFNPNHIFNFKFNVNNNDMYPSIVYDISPCRAGMVPIGLNTNPHHNIFINNMLLINNPMIFNSGTINFLPNFTTNQYIIEFDNAYQLIIPPPPPTNWNINASFTSRRHGGKNKKNEDYYEKYIEYKLKYLNLKNK